MNKNQLNQLYRNKIPLHATFHNPKDILSKYPVDNHLTNITNKNSRLVDDQDVKHHSSIPSH